MEVYFGWVGVRGHFSYTYKLLDSVIIFKFV